MNSSSQKDISSFIENWIMSSGLDILQKNYLQLWQEIKTVSGPPTTWLEGFRIKGRQVVTAGEIAFEGALRAALGAAFPGHIALWGEELGDESATQGKIIAAIDPVDGTASMLASVALEGTWGFGISIGWIKEGRFWGGHIFVLEGQKGDLRITEIWRAFAGEGAFCNGKKVHAPDTPSASLYCTVPRVMFTDVQDRRGFWALECMAQRVVTDMNCVGFVRAAQEGATALEADLTIHDVAALVPILEAMGMRVTDMNGAPLEPADPRVPYTIHAAHPSIHAAQQAALHTATQDPPLESVLFRPNSAPHARKF